MSIDIKAIKARCEAATEGPWDDDTKYCAGMAVNLALDPKSHVSVVMAKYQGDVALISNTLSETQQRANSSFIAHTRQDLPDCLDEIERLRECLESMCYQYAYWSEKDGGGLWTGGMSALEGAFETLGWDDPHTCPDLQCDEPGCNKQSSCGWPSDKGYRRTCSGHRKK